MRFPMFSEHGSIHTCRQIHGNTGIYHSTWQEPNGFLHWIYYNWILPNWYTRYVIPRGQDHFWHVLQTCPDRTNTTIRPVSFFGVDFLLGTCKNVKSLNNISFNVRYQVLAKLHKKSKPFTYLKLMWLYGHCDHMAITTSSPILQGGLLRPYGHCLLSHSAEVTIETVMAVASSPIVQKGTILTIWP